MKYHIDKILSAINGSWSKAPKGLEVSGFSIDSRTVQPGDLFFAFRGDVRDGHEFVASALKAGAVAAVVRNGFHDGNVNPDKLIFCEKGLKALHDLASLSRDEEGLKVVGITGSCGKTTTKDITATLLSSGLKTDKSWGNYNNIWGQPLALLRRQPGMEAYVCEMGMSFPGELSKIARIARPDIMILTNVRPVHMVNFKSLQEIAEAKAEAFQGLKPGGTIVANADDPEVMRVAKREGVPVFTFGIEREADLMISKQCSRGVDGISFTLKADSREYEFTSPLPGTHNLYNLLAGLSAGYVLGLSPQEMMANIGQVELSPLRGRMINFSAGWTLFDDSYNSNPAALSSVLRMISESERFFGKIAVIGDMLELGNIEEATHRQIGNLVAGLGFDKLVTVGALASLVAENAENAGMAEKSIFRCENASEVASVITEIVREGEIVLVKGSRGVNLDQAVEELIRSPGSLEKQNGVSQTI